MISSRKGPQADTVSCPAEEIPDTSDFFKSDILGQNVAHLIHSGAPTKAFVKMIENFDCIGTFTFSEEDVYLFSKPLGSAQAIASKLRWCRCFQTVGFTRGRQFPFSLLPLACTRAPSFGLRGLLVATSVANATDSSCCIFSVCMKVAKVGVPMKKSRCV